MASLPHSVLFCCDHNATRSPMAEGMMKKFYGREVYVQSVGLKSDLEIDGFTIAVCHEIGVDLTRHRARDFNELADFGDELESFDLVVALTPASRALAEERITSRSNTGRSPTRPASARGARRDWPPIG